MPTVIEAIYENGMLKPLVETDLKEQQRYELLVKEAAPAATSDSANHDPYRRREYEWLRQHQVEYAGQYVALQGDQLISHADNLRELYRLARAAGCAAPFIIRVEAPDELPFGGW